MGKRTAEHNRKISIALKGKPKLWLRKKTTERMCPCGKIIYLTPGRIRPKHGKYCSRTCYYKYRIIYSVSSLSHELKGEKHWNYKGNKAQYKALHLRVNEKRGKALICEECNSNKYVEWASLTGKYEDINDYKALCRRCHKKYDLSKKGGDVTA